MSTRSKYVRVFLSVLVGATVAAAPYLYYWHADWAPLESEQQVLVALLRYGPVLLGSFVVSTLASSRPVWWPGTAFGFVLALSAILVVFRTDREAPEFGGMWVLGVGYYAVLGGLVGTMGGLLSSIVARPLLRQKTGGRPRRLQPWTIGVAVAVAELAVILIAVAVRRG